MDDAVFPPNNMFGNPYESMVDFDYIDELVSDGCWLEATDRSEFINYNDSISVFDPVFLWPTLEFNNINQIPEDVQNQTADEILSKAHVGDSVGFEESFHTTRRWWIPPNVGVKERLLYAIGIIKHSMLQNQNALIQIWLPENRRGNRVLSTSDQLYSLGSNCPQLSKFRNISESYCFAAGVDSKDIVGLPGRVFMGKVPEWTPDVQLFKPVEYPRVVHAQQYDVRGSVAVPIFDHDRQSCLGVIEVVMTTRKSNYTPEIEDFCKALEAVNLRSSEPSKSPKLKVTDEAALPEILEILKSGCTTHNLPLAQTWVLCIQQGKDGRRHSDTNLIHCISTMDPACYVHDPRFKDFQEACSEHHLLKGQGVVGRAFTTNQACYVSDVTSMTKTEYPLSHHARVFGLCGVVAIRFRSTLTGNVDYVLEFFLPVDCKEEEKQMELLNSLSSIIENVSQNLRIVTDKELLEEASVKVEKVEEILTEKPVDLIIEQHNESGSGEGNSVNDGINRRGWGKTEKNITLEMLRQYFAGSLKDAAKNLGVCPTTLKRICRQHGIQRWPSRKLKKVGHSLQKIQRVMDSVSVDGSFQIESFYSNFPKLASKTSTFAASKVQTIDSKGSPSSSCSQPSSSGQSSSCGTPAGLKRAQSDAAELHASAYSQDEEKVSNRPNGGNERVKVTYGEEKIRFRLRKDWGYDQMLEEIAKRFSINDIKCFQIKYFDDDSEWVLLTCDADLEECIDVYRSSKAATVQLALFEPHHA
ncbi:hypothetical protein R6Q57_005978 [Mikania cordata]